MTGTIQPSFLGSWDNGTREVSALLAKCDKSLLLRSQKQTTVVCLGIGESYSSAHRYLLDGNNLLQRKLALAFTEVILKDDPELAGRKRQTMNFVKSRRAT